jgi:hypothetical protein
MTARKTLTPADAWKAAIEQASPDELLAAALAANGPVQLAPGEIIAAARYSVSRAIADNGEVLLSAVDERGNTVGQPVDAKAAETSGNGDRSPSGYTDPLPGEPEYVA